jgi:hypothetical protein
VEVETSNLNEKTATCPPLLIMSYFNATAFNISLLLSAFHLKAFKNQFI